MDSGFKMDESSDSIEAFDVLEVNLNIKIPNEPLMFKAHSCYN